MGIEGGRAKEDVRRVYYYGKGFAYVPIYRDYGELAGTLPSIGYSMKSCASP